MKNPAHRVLEAIGVPFGWERGISPSGAAKRRAKRKIARASRRYNLRREA